MTFDQFYAIYLEITKDCPFNTDPNDTFYYYAESNSVELNNNLLAKNVIEIDISGAFPSICKFIFGVQHWFVQKIYEFDNKFDRNKYIAIELTHNRNLIDNGLKLLNSWCKIISLGYVYNNFADVTILEFKKDGLIFTGSLNYAVNEEFNKFIENVIDIKFHIDLIRTYIRFNKTSVFDYLNKPIEIKGKYKSPPIYLIDNILPKVFNKEFFNDSQLQRNIKDIYTELYYEILYKGGLHKNVTEYYKFSNKFVQSNGELQVTPTNPKFILFHFLYPIITLTKEIN